MPRRLSRLQAQRVQDSPVNQGPATMQQLSQNHGKITIEGRGLGNEGTGTTHAEVRGHERKPQIGGVPYSRPALAGSTRVLRLAYRIAWLLGILL